MNCMLLCRNVCVLSVHMLSVVCVQIIITQFGGMFFYTIGLAADQWMWCVFIGVGSLLWGQVCDVVPSSHSLSRASSPLVSFSA